MNDTKNNTESINEIKIIRPKVINRCTSKKIKKSPSASSTSSSSSSNSNKNQNQNIHDSSKNIITNLDNVTLEEINNDFNNYERNLEEEECHNEILNILENDIDSDDENNNTQKVKRCKNPYDQNLEFMKDSYFNELFNEFNDIYSNQME